MPRNWTVVLVACLLLAGVLKMGFFDNLFGKNRGQGGAERPAVTFPWESHPSIYEHIQAHLKPDRTGLTDLAETLPDEEKIAKGSKLRWVAGGLDGVFSHHGSKTEDTTADLVALLKEYSAAPSSENKLKVYKYAVENPALSLIDPLLTALRKERTLNASRLHDLAKSFATQSPDREAVKLGLGMLGMFQGGQDKAVFLTLGQHEEFTLYCTVALANTLDDAEEELWRLAQQVHGWGRIQIVERLTKTQNPRIQDWLLRDGYKNSVMNEYLAFACATGGGLRSALEAQDVDEGMLTSAGEIIDALIAGGPAEGLDQYGDGAAVVDAYLKHLASKASTLKHFLTASAIQRWLSSTKADWTARESRGWTPEKRTLLLGRCREIMDRPLWKEQVLVALKSDDAQVFYDAGQAADVLGIETWTYLWERLRQHPTNSACWYPVMTKCNADRISEVITLAEKYMPMEKIATGPALESGLGKEFEGHQCLDYILQELGKFPGNGAVLIKAGLRSPVIRNRNFAVKTLSAWGKQSWPNGLEKSLKDAFSIEPDEGVKERIQRVLDGRPLDDPHSGR